MHYDLKNPCEEIRTSKHVLWLTRGGGIARFRGLGAAKLTKVESTTYRGTP